MFAKKTLQSLAILAMGTMAGSIYGGSDQATIMLTGTVDEVINVDMDATPGYDSLDLNGNLVDVEIARLSYEANAKDGFTVLLNSDNDLNLTGSGTAEQNARYTLKYLNIANTENVIGKVGEPHNLTYLDGTGVLIENIGTQTSSTDVSDRTLKLSYSKALFQALPLKMIPKA